MLEQFINSILAQFIKVEPMNAYAQKMPVDVQYPCYLLNKCDITTEFLNSYYFKYPILYYQNFLSRVLGLKEISSYNSFFDPHVNQTYKIADFLRQEKEGPIFVWGDEPLIYALSRRSPVGRFSAAYNISWQESRKKETLEKLHNTPPVFIFIIKPVHFTFSGLDNLINENYEFIRQIEDVSVYAKKS